MHSPFSPCDGLVVLPSDLPAGPFGVLPIYATLIRGAAPVLVDTGMARDADAFIDQLDSLVDLGTLDAIVVTHEDADHAGALDALVKLAPRARLVVTPTGAGKLSSALDLPLARTVLVEPGQTTTLGGRRFRVLSPPLYDSPATLMLFEQDARWLFASDAFGGFLPAHAEHLAELHPDEVAEGIVMFGRANSPWVADLPAAAWHARVDAVAALAPTWLMSAHLPPAPVDQLGRVWEATRQVHATAGARVAMPLPHSGPPDAAPTQPVAL